MSPNYFLPLRVPSRKKCYTCQFQYKINKTRKHVSRHVHYASMLPHVSQFCHTGIDYILKESEHASSGKIFSSMSKQALMFVRSLSKGQILNKIEWDHWIPLCISDSHELWPKRWVLWYLNLKTSTLMNFLKKMRNAFCTTFEWFAANKL